MKIDIIISADYIRKDIIENKVVVVIDMLRATSVITTALMNGCKKVIPTLTIEEALKLRASIGDKDCILGGERNALKIDDFDLSNSPLEYTKEVVEGKTIVITTTNGTRTLTSCLEAKRIFVACMLNASAIAEKLLSLNEDVVIVNAGTNGQFSMDDFICSGVIIKALIEKCDKLELTDLSKTALLSFECNPNIIDFIKEARHYNVMIGLGLRNDVGYCIKKDLTTIVPEYKDGEII